ncbi:putative ATP-dependent helicase YprA [Phytophthora cinnamomi]|uniref:putative ATP-dependent helicase YprA n=1 Tax=Phytophthora cinnamomi TaxID=4785 RepID=UPI0035598085|nr:putative ATP-dependent helicase YprA [Phytophthora cinnamomi]
MASAQEELLRRHFALVDAAFCFVAKHRAAPNVRSVLRVANSFGGAQLSRQNLLELATVAPNLLVLETPKTNVQPRSGDVFSPTPSSDEDAEVLTFPLAPQTSQRASTKRKKMFDAALKKINLAEKPQAQTKEQETSIERATDVASGSTIGAKKATSPMSDQQAQPENDWGSSVLTKLQQLDLYKNQIVHVERRRSREAQYRDLEPLRLSPQVSAALEKCYSIKRLYSHQFEAVEAIRRGENAVLSTATASGKSLAYNVPMLDMLLEDPNATFMYLFPTKALAQDQLKSLRRFLEAADLPLHIGATFDGDTPMKSRSMVIRETRIFLTNPDMLHLAILPQHRQWKTVLSNLRILVVDEAHMYRGRPLKVITEDGAPSVEKLFCVWNPKVSKTSDAGNLQQGNTERPRPMLSATDSKTRLASAAVGKRKRTEETANPNTANLLHRVSSYRGGYTLDSRRRIEQRLFSGDLLGVVATNALELGRAGRRQGQSKQKQSVAIIVCFDAPLDQHFAQKQHATKLFQLEPEASGTAYIDSYVFGVLNDDGIAEGGGKVVRSEINEILQPLVKERKLMECSEVDGHKSYRIHSCMPKKFRAVCIRSISDENYVVVVPSNDVSTDGADGEVLDEIPGDRAFFQVYPTAVYLHQAQEYLITRLDNVQRIAFAKKCLQPLTYFTTCRDFTDLEVVRIHRTNQLGRETYYAGIRYK